MTHARTYPGGFPGGPIPSSFLTAMDRDIAECVDGVGGGTYGGNIILTNLHVSGTSVWNTPGDITAGTITATADVVTDGLSFSGAAGTWCALDTYVQARTILADRVVTTNAPAQALDTDSVTSASFDFTLNDTFEVSLVNGASSAQVATLTTAFTITDTSGTTELKVKKGAKISITFRAAAGQTGGIGLHPNCFPASFQGFDVAAAYGPQTGKFTGLDGEEDWMNLALENIGTDAAPVYSCRITMGAKL